MSQYKNYPRLKPYPDNSPEARTLNLLGDKWTLLVMKTVIEEGPIRFVDMRQKLSISNEQLRKTCNRLVEAQLLTRTRYREVPPRVDYEATDKGKGVKPILKSLVNFDSKWAS
jgi:DNA-binding HxlR family transcriptional regulator